ncbi:MAG: PqiC family protein [Pseudomonadota bacterium]
MSRTPILMILGLSLGASACSSAPDPVLYTLADPNIPSVWATDQKVIGLSELSLPAYARNQQITTAVSTYRLSEDDDHRWASPPSEALTAALSKALESSTGNIVLQRPFPAGVRPDIRLSITFDRLLRGAEGDAQMSGQYLVQIGEQPAQIKRFAIITPGADRSYEAYMAALSKGLMELGTQIAAQLDTAPSS